MLSSHMQQRILIGAKPMNPLKSRRTLGASRPTARTPLPPINVINFVAPDGDETTDSDGVNLISRRSNNTDLVFVDEQGQRIPVLNVDYGFRSGGSRKALYKNKEDKEADYVPTNIISLAIRNFKRELKALRRSVRFEEYNIIGEVDDNTGPIRKLFINASTAARDNFASVDKYLEGVDVFKAVQLPKDATDPNLTPAQQQVLESIKALTLNDSLVAAREARREREEGRVNAPWYVRFVYGSLCWVLDLIYEGSPIRRFWFLETVARMPYFSYISMLHLYESLGWWREGAELRRVHFAEEWNELHHLQIMESLGGDRFWADRFMAQHAAVFYFWLVVVVYMISPSASYAFSELVENHASDTYAEFAEQNKELLKTIPPPLVALNYYKAGDLYMFDSFMTNWEGIAPRRPPCNNLYDVFINIRDDETEHIKTMKACKEGTLDLEVETSQRLREVASEEGLRSVFLSDCTDEDCMVTWDVEDAFYDDVTA